MELTHPLAHPLARIGRSLVWTTSDERLVVKYVPVSETPIRGSSSSKSANELNAARKIPSSIGPRCFGWRYEHELPTGERGFWLSLWHERFPHTLLEWGKLDGAQTTELFRVVRAMHRLGFSNGDLHARNIVLRKVEGRSLPDIRIIDYGLACFSSDPVERLVREIVDWRSFEYAALRRLITCRASDFSIFRAK